MTVAASSAIAPLASVLRKSLTGAARLRAHAVRPLSGTGGAGRDGTESFEGVVSSA